MSFSRSIRLSSGFSVSQRCSMTRRMSRRRLSLARSLTRLKSSRSTSLLWMVRLSSSRFLPPPEEVPPKLGLDRRDSPARPLLPWFDRLFSFEIPCCKRDISSPSNTRHHGVRCSVGGSGVFPNTENRTPLSFATEQAPASFGLRGRRRGGGGEHLAA